MRKAERPFSGRWNSWRRKPEKRWDCRLWQSRLFVKKARLVAIFSEEGLEECFRQSRKLPARLAKPGDTMIVRGTAAPLTTPRKSGGAGGTASCRGFKGGAPKPCRVTHFPRTCVAVFVDKRLLLGVFQQSKPRPRIRMGLFFTGFLWNQKPEHSIFAGRGGEWRQTFRRSGHAQFCRRRLGRFPH